MKTTGQSVAASLILLLAIGFLSARAAENEDGWKFISSPFLWGSGMEGDLTVRGIDTEIDLGFDDLFDVTDFGFQAYLELRKEKFGFYASPSFMKLSGDGQTHLTDVEFEQDFWLVEGGGFYNLVQRGQERPFTLDALAGVRYWNVNTELDFQGRGPAGLRFKAEGHFTSTDPIVGLRLRQYLTKRISLSLRGDVGGFDLSDEQSKSTWQGMALLGYDFKRKLFNKQVAVYGGYRGLGIDKEEGGGRSRSEADLTLHGALLGLEFRF